jgi:hypothetical protein
MSKTTAGTVGGLHGNVLGEASGILIHCCIITTLRSNRDSLFAPLHSPHRHSVARPESMLSVEEATSNIGAVNMVMKRVTRPTEVQIYERANNTSARLT